MKMFYFLIINCILKALVSSRVNAVNFSNRVQELESDQNNKGKNGYSEEFEVILKIY